MQLLTFNQSDVLSKSQQVLFFFFKRKIFTSVHLHIVSSAFLPGGRWNQGCGSDGHIRCVAHWSGHFCSSV